MVCKEGTSEHYVNEIEHHHDDQFLITMLICKKCRDFHEQYLNALEALGYGTDKSNQHEKPNLFFEIAYFLGKTKQKRVIAFYSKGDELSSDYGISYIPIDEDGRWKFILKKELTATVLSNMEKISDC